MAFSYSAPRVSLGLRVRKVRLALQVRLGQRVRKAQKVRKVLKVSLALPARTVQMVLTARLDLKGCKDRQERQASRSGASGTRLRITSAMMLSHTSTLRTLHSLVPSVLAQHLIQTSGFYLSRREPQGRRDQ